MSASFPSDINKSETVPVQIDTVELGNSDRIRLKFGSYGIEIIENDLKIRVSNLYSVEDGVRTSRTFAVVVYPSVIEPAFSKEHDEITNGQSIGIVFKNNGWAINKHHQYFGKVEGTSENPAAVSSFGDIGSTQPVVHVYSLFVKKYGAEYHYASIAEVHHPQYLGLDDLKAIYGDEYQRTRVVNTKVRDLLDVVKTKILAV
jgi:hypothetical protein